MNIRDLDKPKPSPEPPAGSVMVVSYARGEANPTQWIADLEQEMLARSEAVTQVTNADENAAAFEAQAGLARYIRAVQNAEEKAKAPLNALRKKILDLSKSLIARCDEEGNRLGKLVAEFQTAETKRIGAIRRAQDEAASALERERDQKIAVAQSTEQIEAIAEEYRDAIAAEAKPVEPVRVNGQRISEEWDVTVTDIHALYRSHPICCKLTPLVSEIKSLLKEGIVPKGITAKKVTKAGVTLGKEPAAIDV